MNEAHDAYVTRNDAAIIAGEQSRGITQVEVRPSQRRAFDYGRRAALEEAAKCCEEYATMMGHKFEDGQPYYAATECARRIRAMIE